MLGAENSSGVGGAGLGSHTGQVPCLLQRALQDTGETVAPSPASVTMVGPAIPRMGAVFAPQAGLDPSAW